MENKKPVDNKKILRNYFIISLIFGLIIIAIIGRAAVTSFDEGKYWVELGNKAVRTNISIPATRGNIYSANGELMATTEPTYRLYMDYWADGLKADTLKKYAKPLAVELNKLLPQKTVAQYEANLMDGLKLKEKEEVEVAKVAKIKGGEKKVVKRSREYAINTINVNYRQLKAIQRMPFFRQGRNKSGLYTREFVKRTKPYGTLASRTIGNIWEESVKGGKYGLELAYDSLLRGKPGTGTRRRVEGRNMTIVDVKPVTGKDIISTIDVNIQDIAEKALMDKIKGLDAESGTAVVLEVKTGAVKAITNLGRIRDGVWGEIDNYAVTDLSEPGSTFKVASMMVALEDGLVQPDDLVDVGNGRFEYGGATLLDHNAHRGGYGMINAAKAIWFSSNIGVAKIILRSYEKDPGKYVDGLYRIGFDKDLALEIPGYKTARIRHPKDSPQTWYRTTLPWMSFGYETQIPPIYTLTFFNAIANDGKMVKPLFVKEIQEDGKTKERKKTAVLNEHICSERTLGFIREMLDSVVNHPQGTGKPAHSNLVRIAGKTGTAQLSHGAAGYKEGGLSHQVSFCGYFPSNEPKYSCIVVIRKPRNEAASGGNMCGTVFKRIAEEIYVQNIISKPGSMPQDNAFPKIPKVKSGLLEHSKYVLKKLNINYSDKAEGKWMTAQLTDEGLVMKDRKIQHNLVPNVIGMGAKDAVYALENSGLSVNLLGRGAVFSQSIISGSSISKGQTITIQLK
ncbi:MAG: PASTA domain-containing protein [Dysgonamonadaceae bacterium]|jgi:cell division protein FtsI (penicillin-binding protein 3)|nr:PASTA domain-containing protein [Dysgonamonadaceae bacterium]